MIKLLTTSAFVSLLTSPVNSFYIPGTQGEFIECEELSISHGICGSEHDNACVDPDSSEKTSTGLDCSTLSYPVESNNTTNLSRNDGRLLQTIDGWKCGKWGTWLSCDSPFDLIVGICGSSSKSKCDLNSDLDDSNHCIKCGPTTAPYSISTTERYRKNPVNPGVTTYCTESTVPCGDCMSGQDPNCVGKSHAVECCKYVDCTPVKITAEWVPVFSGSTAGSAYSVTEGTAMGGAVQFTEAMGASMEASASKGFSWKHVTVTANFAGMVTKGASATFEKAVTTTTTTSCSFGPFTLWRYEFSMEGSCPTKVYTNSYACTSNVAEEPCCLPGYSLDEQYQQCYEPSPTVCHID